jgi:hypothetical protein
MNQGTGVARVLVITYTKNMLVPSWPFPQTPRGHRRKNTELNSNGEWSQADLAEPGNGIHKPKFETS